MRHLLPGQDASREISTADLLAAYAYPADRPWVRANMVATVDGAAAGGDGRSGTLSTPPDRRVFSLLRGLADVVVAGSGTAVAERFGPPEVEPETVEHRRAAGQPPAARLAVTSSRLDLDLDGPLLRERSDAVLVLTTEAAPADLRAAVAERAEVVVAGDQRVDPVRALAALSERGLHRVLCEGGPTLLASWVAAGVVDELCLTTAPLLSGSGAGRVLAGAALAPPVPLELAGLLEEDGTLLARWLLTR